MQSDELEEQIMQELKMCDLEGINLQTVEHNIFTMDVQLLTAIQTLFEELDIDEEDFNERYKKNMLEKLRIIRKQARKAKPKFIIPGMNGDML